MAEAEVKSLGVIIVNYNSGDLLEKCIEQLALQEPQPDRVIVVDNASVDESLSFLRDEHAVELLVLSENVGFAAANNVALERLGNIDLVLTLNPDAFLQKGCLRELLAASTAFPQYDSFACRMMADGRVVDGAGDNYHITGLVWRHLHNCELGDDALVQQEVFSPCAGAAMYRRQALEEVGGFDASFFCYVEDVDLGYRLQLAGKKCLYLPDAVVTHIGSAISDKYPGFAVYHGHRNLVWTFLKNTPGPLLILMLPLHLLMSAILLIVFACKGQGVNYLRAKYDAIRGVPRVWKQRKRLLSERKIGLLGLLKIYDYSIFRKRSSLL